MLLTKVKTFRKGPYSPLSHIVRVLSLHDFSMSWCCICLVDHDQETVSRSVSVQFLQNAAPF